MGSNSTPAKHPVTHSDRSNPISNKPWTCAGGDTHADQLKYVKEKNTWTCFEAGTKFIGGSADFNYRVAQGNDAHYFAFGIAPLCIFCAAIFALFWGALAGIFIRRINMTDYEGVQKCIETYKKSEETIRKAGLKPQAPVQEVMDTLNKVGVRITNVSIFQFQYVCLAKDDVDLFSFNNTLNF